MNTNIKNLKDKIEDTADNAANTVANAAEKTTEAARNFAADVSSHASDAATALHDMAADQISDARDALSKSGDRLAETLRRAADAPNDGSVQGRVMSAMASGASSVADTLRDRSFTDIANDVRALARRNPGAFAAGAAVAGFALARFLRASTRHHRVTPGMTDLPLAGAADRTQRGQQKDGVHS